MGRRLPSAAIAQPARATTPGAEEPTAARATTLGAEEPTLAEEAPSAQEDGGVTPETDGLLGNVNPSPTSDPPAGIHLPQLPRRLDGEISYENQGIVLF